jgi:hypothetical protein
MTFDHLMALHTKFDNAAVEWSMDCTGNRQIEGQTNVTVDFYFSDKKIGWCQQINTAAIVNKLPNLCLVCLPLTRNVPT